MLIVALDFVLANFIVFQRKTDPSPRHNKKQACNDDDDRAGGHCLQSRNDPPETVSDSDSDEDGFLEDDTSEGDSRGHNEQDVDDDDDDSLPEPEISDWDTITEIAQQEQFSIESAVQLTETCRDLIDADIGAESFLAQDGALDGIKRIIPLVNGKLWMGLLSGWGGKGKFVPSEFISAAESLCVLLAQLIRSGGACSPMEPLWCDAVGFADSILTGFDYQVDSQREAACAAYWIVHHLLRHQGAREHFYRRRSNEGEDPDIDGIISPFVETMEWISFSHHQHLGLADKMPLPLILPRRCADGRIVDFELTPPLYASLCALVTIFDVHLDNRQALSAFVCESGVEKVLAIVTIFGHRLGLVCLNDTDPDPSIMLLKALELVQAALRRHCLPYSKGNEQWEKSEEKKRPLTECLVAQLMQIVADVRLQSSLWSYHGDTVQTIPAVRDTALSVLHNCVPEAMWHQMLIGSASAAATSFVLWLIKHIYSERIPAAEPAVLLFVHALKSARAHLEVGSGMYRTFQKGADGSPGYQAVLNVLRDNPALEFSQAAEALTPD